MESETDIGYFRRAVVGRLFYAIQPIAGNLSVKVKRAMSDYIGDSDYVNRASGFSMAVNHLIIGFPLHYYITKHTSLDDSFAILGTVIITGIDNIIRLALKERYIPAGLFGLGWLISKPIEGIMEPDETMPSTPEAMAAHIMRYERSLERRLRESQEEIRGALAAAEARNNVYLQTDSLQNH